MTPPSALEHGPADSVLRTISAKDELQPESPRHGAIVDRTASRRQAVGERQNQRQTGDRLNPARAGKARAMADDGDRGQSAERRQILLSSTAGGHAVPSQSQILFRTVHSHLAPRTFAPTIARLRWSGEPAAASPITKRVPAQRQGGLDVPSAAVMQVPAGLARSYPDRPAWCTR